MISRIGLTAIAGTNYEGKYLLIVDITQYKVSAVPSAHMEANLNIGKTNNRIVNIQDTVNLKSSNLLLSLHWILKKTIRP